MRLLPTTGKTMVNDHFVHLTDGVRIESPLIWECTRFCLAPDSSPGAAAALMLAGGEVMRNFGVRHYVGVFDARMVRIYRRIGACPEILGSQGPGREKISVGLWEFTKDAQVRVAESAGITPAMSARWCRDRCGCRVRTSPTTPIRGTSDSSCAIGCSRCCAAARSRSRLASVSR